MNLSPASSSTPRLFRALFASAVFTNAAAIIIVVEHAECLFWLHMTLYPFLCGLASFFVIFAPFERRKKIAAYHKRIKAIEGKLPNRLRDGSLRLLRVQWLLDRPDDWVIARRQDLPEAAFWSADDACRLLREGRVAALSYKWQGPFNSGRGGGDQPDGKRFHLSKVLDYFREGKHAETHTALFWDFASCMQHHPVTGEKRDDKEQNLFDRVMKVEHGFVMSRLYASPNVLVLMSTRIYPELERELDEVYGGEPPVDRKDLVPYSGAKCRSGWCTSEMSLALLMTAGGGHAYELGKGPFRVVHGMQPTIAEMEKVFNHESTRFMGKADEKDVCKTYVALRKELEAYEEIHRGCQEKCTTCCDTMLTEDDKDQRCGRLSVILFGIILYPCLVFTMGILLYLATPSNVSTLVFALAGGPGLSAIIFALLIALSRIFRAHVEAMFGLRPRDSLRYAFHRSLLKPPFRPRSQSKGSITSGLEWHNIGDEKPHNGQELFNEGLSAALEGKTVFSKSEWYAFEINGLREDNFIKAGASYFKPAAIVMIPQCLLLPRKRRTCEHGCESPTEARMQSA